MKKFGLLVITLIIATQISLAQDEKHGMVHLKDRTLVRGIIVEKPTEQTVEITAPNGDVFIYSRNEISRIKYDRTELTQKGFFSTVSLNAGGFIDSDYWGSVHYIGNYRFCKRFSLGLGVGVGHSEIGYWHEPGHYLNWRDAFETSAYLHGQFYFAQHSRIMPYLSFSAGVLTWDFEDIGFLGGMSFNGKLAQLTPKVHLCVGVGCRVQIMEEVRNVALPQISLGITF